MSHRVADALGEAAVLLNTVNVQGMGRGGGSFPTRLTGPMPGFPSRSGGQGADAQAAGSGAGRGASGGSNGSRRPPNASGGAAGNATGAGAAGAGAAGGMVTPPATAGVTNPPVAPAVPAAPQPPKTFVTTQTPGQRGNAPRGPGSAGSTAAGQADPRIVVADDGMKIDMTQLRRNIYREILPQQSAEQLTPEERQRVAREVNQRMLGIAEGIKLSAAELEKQAQQTRERADTATKRATAASDAASTKSGTGSHAPASLPTPPAAPAVPAPAAPPPAAAAPAVTNTPAPSTSSAPPPSPLKRTAEFEGNRLDIRFERNGHVVRTVNAEINLPNMLMTVFQSTPREQGELPFAVDKDGKVYAQSDEDKKRVEDFGAVATPNGPLGKVVLPEWIVVTTAGPAGTGIRFGIARPTGDSIAALRRTAGRNVGFGLLFIAVALVGVVPVSSRLTRNLEKLTEGVSRIARGDYAARVSLKSSDEIGALATAFNSMAADVEKHQRSLIGQERLKRELELGRQIQHDMLPHGALRLGLTEIKGVSVPAREVGGDFFNYFELPSGQIAMLVGDVSGKGVGAALLMANIQASLRTRLALGQNLAAVAEEIDHDIDQNAPESLYATLFVGMLDPTTRIFSYVNCGHNPQFLLRRSGGLERMASTGLPVGLLAGRGYEQVDVQVQAGDRLFFYTDGCVETENEAGEFFGADRLEAAIASGDNPDDVLAQVERAVEQFRGSRELLDDVTVMAVKVG
jgi:serine phosphatase RsbU (regulator of sigma subunit)